MNRILKIVLFGLIALSFMLCFTAKGQTFKPVPKDSINQWKTQSVNKGTDLNTYIEAAEYYNRAAGGSTAVISGSVNCVDNNADTTNQRLKAIKQYLNSNLSFKDNNADTLNSRLNAMANYLSILRGYMFPADGVNFPNGTFADNVGRNVFMDFSSNKSIGENAARIYLNQLDLTAPFPYPTLASETNTKLDTSNIILRQIKNYSARNNSVTISNSLTVGDFNNNDSITRRLTAIKNYLNLKTSTAALQTTLNIKTDTIIARLNQYLYDNVNGAYLWQWLSFINDNTNTINANTSNQLFKSDTTNTLLRSIRNYQSQINYYNTGATIFFKQISVASINTVIVSATAGLVKSISASNTSSITPAFVKIYNQSTLPNPGSSPVFTYFIPANATISISLPSDGMYFSAGIGIAITGGIADNDNTAVLANQLVLNLSYK